MKDTKNESVFTRTIRNLGRFKSQVTALGIFLGVWAIFSAIRFSTFTTSMIYVAILAMSSIMAIVAVAETTVVISGEFDMSFPSIMGLAGCVFTIIYLSTGNSVAALLGALCVAGVAGALNGVLVAKVGLPSLIATIGTLFLWRGVITGYTQGQIVIRGLTEEALHNCLVGKILGVIPVQFFWAIGVTILFWAILNRHKFGAHVYCIGDNQESAKMMGINLVRTKFLLFTMMGLFAGFAGVITLLEMGIFFPALGDSFFLPILAAVFVGGTPPTGGEGTVFGSFIGALTLELIGVGVSALGAGLWREMCFGLILIVALAVNVFLRRGRR